MTRAATKIVTLALCWFGCLAARRSALDQILFMSAPISLSEIHEFTGKHLASVFDTMLTWPITLVPEAEAIPTAERVSGSVGFAGETVTGAVYLHLPQTVASGAAVAMLALGSPDEASEADVNDVVGEISNMLGGGIKSWLCDRGAGCALTPPAVIRGNSFAIVASPDVQVTRLGFSCDGGSGVIEVHIKFR